MTNPECCSADGDGLPATHIQAKANPEARLNVQW
jgi:hypothetical protein